MKRTREDDFSSVNKRRKAIEESDSKEEFMSDGEPFTPAFASLNLEIKKDADPLSDNTEFLGLLCEVGIIENWSEDNWRLMEPSLKDHFAQCLCVLKNGQFSLNQLPLLNELLDCLNSTIIASRISPNDRTLELNRLGLTRFPAPLLANPDYFEYWTTLERFVLSGNHLSWLPNEIGTLHHLEFLYLDDNALITIPSEIARLSELKVLDIRNNRLQNLPDEIVSLQKLQSLNISQNIIESLPNLSSLIDLRVLQASDNQFTTLPFGLTELKQLEWVDVKRNRLTEESLSVLLPQLGPKWYSDTVLHQNESIFQIYLSNRF